MTLPLLATFSRLNVFRPEPGKRFSRFDLWVYALFEKRWSPLLRDNPDVRADFLAHLQKFEAQRSRPAGKLRLVHSTPGPTSTQAD